MTLWYLARALGLVALVALTASVALGALATVDTGPDQHSRSARLVRQLVHRSVAVTGLVALVLHVAAIVADEYVDVSIPAALVPFTSGYEPFAVGLGVLALWAFVAAAVSGAARGRLAVSRGAVRRWRAVHAAAYGGWLLCMLHGVLAGTDSSTWWALLTYGTCTAAVVLAVAARLVLARPRRVDGAGSRLLLERKVAA